MLFFTYGCLVWSFNSSKNMDSIAVLQKKCLRILNFVPINTHNNLLFLHDKIIRCTDVVKMEQLKLVFQFEHKILPTDILNLFKLNSVVSSQCTRNVFNEGLFVPRIYTSCYGNKSLRYSAPLLWNNILK